VNSISHGAKRVFNHSIHFLNQPVVKESVKNIFGTITFAIGIVQSYDLYQIYKGDVILNRVNENQSRWVKTAHKVVMICAKLSLILSACVSRPGAYIISSLSGCFFTTAQLNRAFGPNTIFAINPKHPRHIASIVAVILSLPTVIQLTFRGMHCVYKKIRPSDEQTNPLLNRSYLQFNHSERSNILLSDSKIQQMAIFNTITSRPVLHIGNLILHRA
jgi:hypothetical protein